VSTDLIVAASAEAAQAKRMDVIANNIANAGTAGFRAAGLKFDVAMQMVGDQPVAFSGPGEVYITRDQGPITYSGNSLDVAIDGDGWLALQSPDGIIYSRDGRMQLTANGDLTSVNGYPVLDSGQGPITLDPQGGGVTIGENGMISQGGKQVAAIGLFLIPDDAKLTRYDNSGVIPDKPADPVEDFTASSLRQGYVEGSNVNPIVEMTRLIEASRAFDQAASAIGESDSLSQEAIKTLAPAS
jgi:flagellar basal-body rod protein FlgF